MVMVPHPPSSGERHANGRPGVSAGNGRLERAPGTPRKDGSATREKAMQDPGLRDYVCEPHATRLVYTILIGLFYSV
jgi:hypothetical protein